jgi:hypothetical protein
MKGPKKQMRAEPHRARMPVGAAVAWAVRHVLATRGTPAAVFIILVAAMPLYAMDYHRGEVPVLGLWVSLAAGGLAAGAAVGVVVASLLAGRGQLALTGVTCMWRWAVVVTLALGGTLGVAIWVARVVVASSFVAEPFSLWITNEYSDVWKPIAHVTASAVLLLGVAPFAALAIPALAVAGGPTGDAVDWMRCHIHHHAYDAFRLGWWCLALAAIAFIPYVGVLAVPVACLMIVRTFHLVFVNPVK